MAITGARGPTFMRRISSGVNCLGKRLALAIRGPKGIERKADAVIKDLEALLAIRGVEIIAYTPPVELAASRGGKTPEGIDAGAAQVDKFSPSAAVQKPEIELPEMIDIPGMPGKRIMKDEVTVGLFKQLMEGYEIEGINKEMLEGILANPKMQNNAVTFISLDDAREFVRRLKKLTRRKFRVPTEEEWKAARTQLSGSNWIWTETIDDETKNTFVLRFPANDNRKFGYPGERFYGVAFLLVEDIAV